MQDMAHILNTATLWVVLVSAMRLAAHSVRHVVPIGGAAWSGLWNKDAKPGAYKGDLSRRMDALYMRLLAALTTPASAFLLYLGGAGIGIGLSVMMAGAIVLLVGFDPFYSSLMRWVGSPITCIGIAFTMAAVSPRRTLSAWVSAGLIVAGLGIGIVTGTMHAA